MISVREQLARLRDLGVGWYDGEQGTSYPVKELDWLIDAFEQRYPDTLPLPYLYPTVEGRVQAEWSFGKFEVEFVIDTHSKDGTLTVFDMSRANDISNDTECCVSLDKEGYGWRHLFWVLQTLHKEKK